MELVNFTSGKLDGGQCRDAFAEYNAKAGSAIVDLGLNYNKGQAYNSQISNGNQLDIAFAAINADASGNPMVLGNQDYGDSNALYANWVALKAIIDAP